MKRKLLLLLAIGVVLFLSLSATVAAQRENIWERTANTLISVAKLDFLDNDAEKLGAFVRILVWIVVFTVVWTALRRLGGGAGAGAGMFTGGASIAIALVFATISTVFISPELLIGIGAGYSTLVAAVLIGFLAIGLLVILYNVLPSMGLQGRLLAFTRILFLVLLLYILDNISGFVEGKFTGGGGISSSLSITIFLPPSRNYAANAALKKFSEKSKKCFVAISRRLRLNREVRKE